MTYAARLEGTNAKHAYVAEVVKLEEMTDRGTIREGARRQEIFILAFNRTAATSLARKAGWEVCSMYMDG